MLLKGSTNYTHVMFVVTMLPVLIVGPSWKYQLFKPLILYIIIFQVSSMNCGLLPISQEALSVSL